MNGKCKVRHPMWFALAIVVVITAGCWRSDEGPGGFRFTNQTDEPIRVVYISTDGVENAEPIVHEVLPGESIVTNDDFRRDTCVEGILVARNRTGVEVARRDEPICQPGEWIIE